MTAPVASPFDPAVADWWLVPDQLFDGDTISAGKALRIADGKISLITHASEAGPDGAPVWRTKGLVSPGFFDVQVNGGGGVLFNTDPTPEGLFAIAAAHRKTGTTAILPTFITDTADALDRAVDAMLVAHGRNGIAGMHIEGPHISVTRKGAHNPVLIRPIDERTFASVERLRRAHVPVLLTLAPEVNPPGSVARLVAMGVVVSIGHTNGDATATRRAIAEGARSATHLYNAMTPITSREAGVVGSVLDSDIYCGFIADGHHVDDAVLRLAFRSRPVPDRMVLVSDAMPTWGGPDHFTLYGETIRLQDGRLVNAIGSLAGVHIDMASSVQRLITDVGLPAEQVLRTATANPARMMGLRDKFGFIRPGMTLEGVILIDQQAPAA